MRKVNSMSGKNTGILPDHRCERINMVARFSLCHWNSVKLPKSNYITRIPLHYWNSANSVTLLEFHCFTHQITSTDLCHVILIHGIMLHYFAGIPLFQNTSIMLWYINRIRLVLMELC